MGSSSSDTSASVPDAPVGLTAMARESKVALQWSAVAEAEQYRVYRTTDVSSWPSTPLQPAVPTPSFTDTTARNGIQYGYRVTAVAGDAEGAPSSPAQARPQAVDRELTASLRERIQAIYDAMPRRDSEAFVVPSSEQQTQWRALDALADNDTTAARALIDASFPSYALIRFTDTATDRRYWLLQEAPTVETGWGTVVIDPSPTRNLAVEMPHPYYDIGTYAEGIDLFLGTGARAFIMAGTSRCANRKPSGCDGETTVCNNYYPVSDVAHATETPFQVTHETLADTFSKMVALNLHGNGLSECETVFLSSGVWDDTSDPVAALRDALLARDVDAADPMPSSCPLVGGTNVQGHYTNGSAAPCTRKATGANGRFIHLEQQRFFREPPDRYAALIEAVNAVFIPLK
ncbi:fibronectin type III domain-containing protein [Salinibacter altiplanensis]|uniref:fibronectin type III domain-containing protein n=1 Tax=Salinibacter altiplanensis TaxID=1803181 RepID=UPI00131A4F07|nr:fibronectin type III domain-containing protein [Salinibacter altiplanensis]